MKRVILLFVILLPARLFSQQYRTIIPSSDAWFVNYIDQIDAIHIDSVAVSGTDTIYWNYPILRINSQSILDTIAPSWVGRYSVLRQNGDEVYFNAVLDSIVFRNYLPLNSTWKMYNFPNGDYIRAKISSISFLSVGPISDTVKTISLQHYNSSNQAISGNFNGLSFGVSRNNGFTQLFDFYNFPNDNFTWTRTSAHRLTYGEVFDFAVGDEYHSLEMVYPVQAPPPTFVRTVIAKNNWGSDSIQYIFHRDDTWYTVQNTILTTYHSASTETLMVYTLDSMIFNEYPKEPVHIFPMISSYDLDFNQLGTCRPLEIQFLYGLYYYDTINNNYPMPFEATTWFQSWIDGNGEYDGYSSIGNFVYFHYYLSFSKKGVDSCGSPLNLGIHDVNSSQNSISLFPNPTSSEIHIGYFSNLVQNINLSITDISGKKFVQNEHISVYMGENDLPIDLSSLANGMYFVVIQDDSGLHAIKFLKN